MWEEIAERQSKSPDGEMEHSESLRVDPGTNIYDFGILMLETISGKVPHSPEEDSIVNWVSRRTELSALSSHLAFKFICCSTIFQFHLCIY